MESLQKSLAPIYADVPASSKVDLRRYEMHCGEEKELDSGLHVEEKSGASGEGLDAFLDEARFDVKKEFATRYLHDARTTGSKKRLASDSVSLGRKRLHREQEEYILHLVRERWESGSPMTKAELRNTVLETTPAESEFYRVCCDPNAKGYPGYLNKFISRVLERGQYVQRKKVIIERVQSDWRQRAEVHAQQIVSRMKLAQVDSIVAADEVFIRFQASQGPKQYKSRLELDVHGVYGCTLFPY